MIETTSQYTSDNNMSNVFVAIFGGLPSYLAAFINESPTTMLFGMALTFVFFILGKAIDVVIKIYFDRRNEEKRLNGIKDRDSQ